jgi:hypothetical protein
MMLSFSRFAFSASKAYATKRRNLREEQNNDNGSDKDLKARRKKFRPF